MEVAAKKAAHAADRATVKYYETLGQDLAYIAKRLNVRLSCSAARSAC